MLLSRTLGAAFALLALLAAIVLPAQAQTATFNFAGDLPGGAGKTTTFTDTNNGISATFSSPDDPFIFQVESTLLKNTPGNVLGPGQVGANFVPLDIIFSKPLTSISLNFGLNGFATSTLSLAAFSGGAISASDGTFSGAAVGTPMTAKGTIPGGIYQFPEGTVQFQSASPFDSVEITSTAQNLAVGNIIVAAAVPEASSVVSFGLLLTLGLGGLVWGAKKRKVLA